MRSQLAEMDDDGGRKLHSDATIKHSRANLEEEDYATGLAIDERKEKQLIWKIDMHILPFVVLLYLFSFLDRGMLSSFRSIE